MWCLHFVAQRIVHSSVCPCISLNQHLKVVHLSLSWSKSGETKKTFSDPFSTSPGRVTGSKWIARAPWSLTTTPWARSRLYRNEILQVNMRWKALAEIYTMHSFALLQNHIFFENFYDKNWDCRAVQRSALHRSRRELSDEYFLANLASVQLKPSTYA